MRAPGGASNDLVPDLQHPDNPLPLLKTPRAVGGSGGKQSAEATRRASRVAGRRHRAGRRACRGRSGCSGPRWRCRPARRRRSRTPARRRSACRGRTPGRRRRSPAARTRGELAAERLGIGDGVRGDLRQAGGDDRLGGARVAGRRAAPCRSSCSAAASGRRSGSRPRRAACPLRGRPAPRRRGRAPNNARSRRSPRRCGAGVARISAGALVLADQVARQRQHLEAQPVVPAPPSRRT